MFFPVYPQAASAAVKDAFRNYDLAFAWALGLERQPAGDDAYAIAPLLARGFYDDGLWE